MGAALRVLLKFWKPIATGVGSVLAWEEVDEVVAPEQKSQKTAGLTIVSTLLVLFVVGIFTGLIAVKPKRKRR